MINLGLDTINKFFCCGCIHWEQRQLIDNASHDDQTSEIWQEISKDILNRIKFMCVMAPVDKWKKHGKEGKFTHNLWENADRLLGREKEMLSDLVY